MIMKFSYSSLLYLLFGSLLLIGCQNPFDDESDEEATTYSIGDTGPAGGVVFCVDSNNDNAGFDYLELAPASKEATALEWGTYGVTVGLTGTAIGTGESNTQRIINVLGSIAPAAQYAQTLSHNGFTDWFLPSKDELNYAHEALSASGKGEFPVGEFYWSSSEDRDNAAWYQRMDSGYQNDVSKSYARRVRPIRSF